VDEETHYQDIPQCEPEAGSQNWLDETLSDDGLVAKERMLEALQLEAQRPDLNRDQRAAKPTVWEYATTRFEIIRLLQLIRSEGDEDGRRRSRIASCKKEVSKLLANEYFAEFLKAFGITEDHPLSAESLYSRGIQQTSSPQGPPRADLASVDLASIDLSTLLPHFDSPWKNAILLALLAKGLDAHYLSIASYISEQLRFVDLPDYCGKRGTRRTNSIHALIEDDPNIAESFQKDRSKVKGEIKSSLRSWCDSLASKVTN